MRHAIQQVTLIGFGAIGRSVFSRMAGHAGVSITYIVVPQASVAATQAAVDSMTGTAAGNTAGNAARNAVRVVSSVPADTQLLLECAGHAALTAHVVPALARGIESAVLSIGALSEPGLPEQLEAAAQQGRTQVHLLSGAVGGVDAIAAARLAGLTEVTYTGRKPPIGWRGSPAEKSPIWTR